MDASVPLCLCGLCLLRDLRVLRGLTILVLSLIVSPVHAGQTETPAAPQLLVDLPADFDGPAPPISPAVISRDASGRATIRAVRVTTPMRWTGASTNRSTPACRRFQTLFSRSRRRARRRPRRPKCGWRLTPTISTSRSAAGRASRTRWSPTRCAAMVRTCGRATTSSPSASTRSTIAATRSTSSPTPSAHVRTDR